MRHEEGKTVNEPLRLIHEGNLSLKGLEIRHFSFNAAACFKENDRLDTAAHAVVVATRANQEREAFQPGTHGACLRSLCRDCGGTMNQKCERNNEVGEKKGESSASAKRQDSRFALQRQRNDSSDDMMMTAGAVAAQLGRGGRQQVLYLHTYTRAIAKK